MSSSSTSQPLLGDAQNPWAAKLQQHHADLEKDLAKKRPPVRVVQLPTSSSSLAGGVQPPVGSLPSSGAHLRYPPPSAARDLHSVPGTASSQHPMVKVGIDTTNDGFADRWFTGPDSTGDGLPDNLQYVIGSGTVVAPSQRSPEATGDADPQQISREDVGEGSKEPRKRLSVQLWDMLAGLNGKQPSQDSQDHAREDRLMESALQDLEEVVLQNADIDMQHYNEHTLRRCRKRMSILQMLKKCCRDDETHAAAYRGWNQCHTFLQQLSWWKRLRQPVQNQLKEELQAVFFPVVAEAPTLPGHHSQEEQTFPNQMVVLSLEKVPVCYEGEGAQLRMTPLTMRPMTVDRVGWTSYTIDSHPNLIKPGTPIHLSPSFSLTLNMATRKILGIPVDATHFSFSYPVKGLNTPQEIPEESSAIYDLMQFGGYVYFRRITKHEEIIKKPYFRPLNMGKKFQVVHLLTVSSKKLGSDNVVSLTFGHPIWLTPHQVAGHWFEKQDITLDFLKQKKTKYFCWIAPPEKLLSEGCPFGYPAGGFLYWGQWKDKNYEKSAFADAGKKYREDMKDMWLQNHIKALEKAVANKHKVEHDEQKRMIDAIREWTRGENGKDKKSALERAREQLDAIQEARFGFYMDEKKSWICEAYFTIFSFRVPFLMILSVLVWIAFVAGMTMELFYTVFGAIYDKYRLPVTSALWFTLLPLIMVFSAVIVDRMWYLILDAFAPPYFVKFRAKLLVVYNQIFSTKDRYDKKDISTDIPSKRSLWLVDLFCWFFLEILPDLGLVYNLIGMHFDEDFATANHHWLHFFFVGHTGLVQALWGGYMTGTMGFCAMITILFVAVEFQYSSLEWHCNEGMTFKFQVQRVEEILVRQKIYPFFNYGNYWAFEFDYKKHPEEQAPDEVHIGRYHHRSQLPSTERQGRLVLGITFALWVGTSTIFYLCADYQWIDLDNKKGGLLQEWLMPLGALMLAVAIIGLSYKISRDMPNLWNTTYWVFLIVLLVMQAAMLYEGKNFQQAPTPEFRDAKDSVNPLMTVETSGSPKLPWNWTGDFRDLHLDEDDYGKADRYPVCRMTWGSDDAPLTVLDLAAIARFSYSDGYRCKPAVQRLLNASFDKARAPEVLDCHGYTEVPRAIFVKFPALPGSGKNAKDTIVIGIKGTSSLKDGYLDTDLFTFIKALQFATYLVPVLLLIPEELLQWGTAFIKAKLGVGGTNEESIWGKLVEKVKKMKKENPNADFVITGHSLGGALAEIVAGQTATPALQWSGPGTHFSERFFDVTQEQMQRNVVAVVPDRDLVPQVDVHDGVKAEIQCLMKHGKLPSSPIACHSLVKSACEIWRVCGDKYKRDYSDSCNEYIAQGDIGLLYPDKYSLR